MTIDDLITKLQDELDDLDLTGLTPDTSFLEIEGWSSLYSLIIMALASTEYEAELSAEKMQHIKTVNDLFNAIQEETA